MDTVERRSDEDQGRAGDPAGEVGKEQHERHLQPRDKADVKRHIRRAPPDVCDHDQRHDCHVDGRGPGHCTQSDDAGGDRQAAHFGEGGAEAKAAGTVDPEGAAIGRPEPQDGDKHPRCQDECDREDQRDLASGCEDQ